jgi:vacuolar-type H+-ATPase subunit E/Vma4
MAPRVVGNPDALINEIIEEFRRDIERRVAEALEASRSLLEKAYDEALRDLEKKLSERLRELEERLRSAEATREVEIRREISTLRAKLVDELLEEALRQLPSRVPRSQYEGFLRRLMVEAKAKAGGKNLKIIPVERDRDIVVRLARELGLEVGDETRGGYGGFLAVTEDGVVLDYTIENVLGDMIDKVKSVIARELFGE